MKVYQGLIQTAEEQGGMKWKRKNKIEIRSRRRNEEESGSDKGSCGSPETDSFTRLNCLAHQQVDERLPSGTYLPTKLHCVRSQKTVFFIHFITP
jgi:hypothetical protein